MSPRPPRRDVEEIRPGVSLHRCHKCHARIFMARNASGKLVPMDAAENPTGPYVTLRKKGGLTTRALPYEPERYGVCTRRTCHLDTCPGQALGRTPLH